jgi:hypothetical protein
MRNRTAAAQAFDKSDQILSKIPILGQLADIFIHPINAFIHMEKTPKPPDIPVPTNVVQHGI